MRQRLEQKRHEQELIEKSQQTLAKSRRSKLSMELNDEGEQRYPEKIILLTKGAKIPWANIILNHGGFKAATLHQAATNLQNEKLDMLIFFGFSTKHNIER